MSIEVCNKVIHPKYSKQLDYTLASKIWFGVQWNVKSWGFLWWKCILKWLTWKIYNNTIDFYIYQNLRIYWCTSYSARNQPIFWSAQIAVPSIFFQMFIVLGMYNFGLHVNFCVLTLGDGSVYNHQRSITNSKNHLNTNFKVNPKIMRYDLI